MFQPKLIEKQAGLGFARAVGSKVHTKAGDATQAVKRRNMELFGQDKVDAEAAKKIREDGNGLIGDVSAWGAGFLTPKSWNVKEKILQPVDKVKKKMDDTSTNLAGKLVQNRKPDGAVQRLFSTPVNPVVGREQLQDGTFREISAPGRKTSLTAPIENTLKVTSPFLASAYVADKMYPAVGNEDQLEKQTFEMEWAEEKNGLEDELLTERLDKKAALDKIAALEEENERLASDVELLAQEKNAFWKKAEAEFEEKVAALKEKERIESTLFEKEANFKEFQLRTTAKERSKHAVKVAEELLEIGMIKQAEFNEKVDFLMECDDKTFKLHSSLSKHAESDEKGLETSAFFIDYRDKDEGSSPHRPGRGINRKGQTIGEAAKELNK